MPERNHLIDLARIGSMVIVVVFHSLLWQVLLVDRRLVVVPLGSSDEARRIAAYPDLGLAVDHLRVESLDPAALPAWQRAGVLTPEA